MIPQHSDWKSDALPIELQSHNHPACKALLHHHWRAGNNSGNQRRSTNGTQPFYDRGADSGHRTHTPKHQILNLACLPFHHIRINCANRGRTCDGGVKVLCLTAWRWRIIYLPYKVLLLSFLKEIGITGESIIMYQHKLIVVENVRFELRFLPPKQACYHYTTFSSMPPTGVEPVLCLQKGILSPSCLPISPQRLICPKWDSNPYAFAELFENSMSAYIPSFGLISPVFPGCQPHTGHFRRKKIS